MKIVDGYPPNIDKIKEKYPDCMKPGTVFAYGDTVYTPGYWKLPKPIRVHEQVHLDRQMNNPEGWWDEYLRDSEFMFVEELAAHRAEYQWWRTYKPHKRLEMLTQIAGRLSGPLYGNYCTFEKAKDLIQRQGTSK